MRADRELAAAARRLAQLKGWSRRGAAVAAGAATALAFAPFYALPLMALGYSVLVLLIDGAAAGPRPRRAAFAVGWFFGFGFHLVGLYWMAFSFFVQAEEFAWMAPFAVTGMPAFLGLFMGAGAALAAALWRPGWRRIFVFAAVWMAFEYARGHVLTGLPWNLPAQALAGTAIGAQSAAWIGAYGLSLVVIAIAGAPAAFAAEGRVLRGVLASLIGAGLLYAAGAVRLAGPEPGAHDDIFVRIIQPNIPQREKIDPEFYGRNFGRHLALSKGDAPGLLYVVWPENAAALIDESADALRGVSGALPAHAVLLTGSVRRARDASDATRYYNSVAIVAETPSGPAVIAHYDKHHLVPFGEYLPLQGLLRRAGLAQLAPYDDGFTPGGGPWVWSAAGPPFAPLICYEAIFPGELYPRGQRPEWLVAVTNDAWFGDTSGPRQHLDQARLRSIETGLPMARSANTGISALIDAKGRLLSRIRLYTEGRIDAPLPKPLAPTLYSRIGDVGFLILFLVVLFLGFAPPSPARVRR
jgi:apolipoprotein N-acyltransferase